MRLSSFAVLLAALLAVAAICFGQAASGIISGVVKDPSGAPVPGAVVTVRNAATQAAANTETNPEGYYRIANLPPGEYLVEAEAKNFRKTIMSPQRLNVGSVLRIDVALEIGAITETVTVEAEATRVNTEDAQLGKVVQDPQGLPILSGAGGRNPLALAGTMPGVVFAGQVADFSVNGQRAQANNYMLDGTDSNDLAINIPDSVNRISPNAISEFRIVTGAMQAEYGRNSGSVILIETRSGGNDFHGGLWETFRNTKLNAVPYFSKTTPGPVNTFTNGLPRKPQWNSNDFDAHLGGRILRDKSFFFLSYLGYRRRQGVSLSATVPNDAQRAAIMASGTEAAKKLLQLIPQASTGNTLFAVPSNARDTDQGLAKWNHSLSQKNQLAFTYVIDYMWLDNVPDAFGGTTIPGFGATGKNKFQNAILRDTHTFTPTLLNEFRASFHRRGSDSVIPLNRTKLSSLGLGKIIPDNPDAEGPPWVIISGFTSYGNTVQGPQARFDNTFQYIDNVSWTRGRHNLKFGGEFRTYAQNQRFTFINNGYIYIDGGVTAEGIVPQIPGISAALNDFANGYATFFVQNSKGLQGYRTRAVNLFWQDNWKVRRTFSLNYGLRWEFNTPITELNDQAATLRVGQKSTVFPDAPTGLVYPGDSGITRSTYKRDLNNFAPRVGFAWDVLGTGRMSVRGGYGIFYDIPITELTLQFLGVPPYGIQPITYYTEYADPWASSLVNPIPQPFPFNPPKRGGSFDFTNVAPLGLTIMDPNFATPYSGQWNLQVQYQLGSNWLLDVGYVGSSGVKLLNRRNINPAVPGPGATTGNTEERRVLNKNHPEAAKYGGTPFSGITDQLTDANSNYHSLQVGVTKRFRGGFSMDHAYTWSHAIDNGSGLRVTARIDNSRLDRGNAEFDVRHRYVMSYNYELPWLKDRKGPLGFALGGWGVSGVTTFQTGVAINISESQDRALNDGGGQRPDYIGGTVTFYDPRRVDAVAGKPNSWFDGTGGGTGGAVTSPFFRRVGTAASWAAGAGRYGTLGRNVFHGPGINNFDLNIAKGFRFAEAHQVMFRAEFFNLFNHTQFGSPGVDIASVNFGRVLSTRAPRIIQFSLKYSF